MDHLDNGRPQEKNKKHVLQFIQLGLQYWACWCELSMYMMIPKKSYQYYFGSSRSYALKNEVATKDMVIFFLHFLLMPLLLFCKD